MAVLAWKSVGRRAMTFALLCLAVFPARARAECKPTALPQGDPALVRTLVTRLAASGIATTEAAGCPVVHVHLEQHGQQLHLRLADAFSRQSERDVGDLATAAAVIASWTTQEVEEGSLPPETPPPPAIPIARSAYRGASVAATTAIGSDGTTWVGAAIGACTRVGPLCAGGSLRGELDTTATGTSSTIAIDTYVMAAYATLDLPRAVGSFVVSPGLALGYGYQHATVHHHGPTGAPLDQVTPDHMLRTGLHVAALRPIAAHWSLLADLWGDTSIVESNSTFGPTAGLRLSFGIRMEGP